MTYFALFYDVVENFSNRRTEYRPSHLKMVRDGYASGELVLGGALQDPPGALLVFKTDDRAAVERFVANDPYVKNGLVTKWWIRPWNVVTGNEA